MRLFEVLLLIVELPLVAWLILARRPWPLAWNALCAMAIVVIALDLFLEGARWQMVPAYAVAAALVVAGLLRRPRSRWGGLLGGALGLVLIVGAAGLSSVLPVFALPQPTGSFAIGTVGLDLVDASRPEPHARGGDAHRELMVQMWYPAETTVGFEPAPYRPSATLSRGSRYLSLVETHSFLGAPLAKSGGRLPVVLFNPNWLGNRFQSTAEMEELASHGFVAVAIDHPYNSNVVAFPDGRVVRAGPDAKLDFSTDDAFRETTQTMDREGRLQAEDARFVLGALARLDAGDPNRRFAGRLDLGNVGIAGHSFGGAVAAQASRLDPRFRAVANLDGWLLADAAEAGVERPYMKFDDDTPRPSAAELSASDPGVRHDAQTTEQDWKRSHASFMRYGGYELTIRGANHMDFSDSPLYSPLKSLTHAGPIGARRINEITDTYLLAFFRKHLSGATEPLLDAPSPKFPEVEFVIWKPVASQTERQ